MTKLKSKREQERRKLEAHFNAEIVRRHRAGESKEEIVAGLGISRELFNRVMRGALEDTGP
ncbi:MAG: hypothetical protein WCO00_13450 [Rhodospirillaceae bacterium]